MDDNLNKNDQTKKQRDKIDKSHDEIFKEFEEHEHEEHHMHEESKFKKYFIFGLGIISVILMLSYIFLPASDYIQSMFASKVINEDKSLTFDNIHIQFTDQAYQDLQDIYFSDQVNEVSVCLLGSIENTESTNIQREEISPIENNYEIYYNINSLYEPKVFSRSFNHVSFEPCSSDTLIMLHSHPYKRCIASDTDLNTLNKTKQNNPNVLMIIMCEPDRFSIYG